MQPSILSDIKDFSTLMRQNAQRDLIIERQLREHPELVGKMALLYDRLRERQRDYAVMIRMNELVARSFERGGVEWVNRHRRLWVFKKAFDKRNAAIDEMMRHMHTRVSGKGK